MTLYLHEAGDLWGGHRFAAPLFCAGLKGSFLILYSVSLSISSLKYVLFADCS